MQLLLEVKSLYDQIPSMCADHRDSISKPIEYWDTQSDEAIKFFLRTTRKTVSESVKQAADMGSGFRTIDSYFPVQKPPIREDLVRAILGIPRPPPEPY